MMHLVLIACLHSVPDSCVERTLSYIDLPSAQSCVMRAQPELAIWSERNPAYFIKHWRCDTDQTRRVPT